MAAVGYGVGNSTVKDSYGYMSEQTNGIYVESSNPTEVTNALIDLINSLLIEKLYVVRTSPEHGATDVAPDVTIEVEFNKPVDPVTLNIWTISINTGIIRLLTGIKYDEDSKVLSIKPLSKLLPGQSYLVVLTSHIREAGTENYLTKFSFSFTPSYSSEKERVQAKIDDYRNWAIYTLQENRNKVAEYMSEGVTKCLTLDKGLVVLSDITSMIYPTSIALKGGRTVASVTLYGPGTKGITQNFRNIINGCRFISFIDQAEGVYEISSDAIGLAGIFGLFAGSKHDYDLKRFAIREQKGLISYEEAIDHFDNDYQYFAFQEYEEGKDYPILTHKGINSINAEIISLFDDFAEAIPEDLSKEQADKIVDFIEMKMLSTKSAAKTEVHVAFYDPDALMSRDLTLGAPHTFQQSFDFGMKNWGWETGIKVTVKTGLTIWGAKVKAGGFLAIAGGVTTPAGAGGAVLGDVMMVAPIGMEWIHGFFAESNPELSPTHMVYTVIWDSYDKFNFEIDNQIKFHKGNINYISEFLMAKTKSLGIMNMVKADIFDISLTNIILPPINMDTETFQEGEITVTNNSETSYNVSLTGSVLGPNISGHGRSMISIVSSSSKDVAPGESHTMTFNYGSINTSDFDVEGFEVAITATCINQSTGEIIEVGPVSERLIAGTAKQIETLNLATSDKSLSGILSPGDRQEILINIPGGLQSIAFNLTVSEGSDADLHIFDSSNNHVGMNYSTEEIENQILGAEYSGSTVKNEYIKLVEPESGTYRIRVVGHEGNARFTVTKIEVPVMPAILSVDTKAISVSGLTNDTVNFNLLIKESGGGNEITNLLVNKNELTDGYGHIIPIENITIGSYSNTIPKNGSQEIEIAINTTGVFSGTYTGQILITGSGDISDSVQVELYLEDQKTIPLAEGWNLISLNIQPGSTYVKSVIETISEYVICVWAYKNGEWLLYAKDKPGFSDLMTIEAENAFWVNMDVAADLTISGLTAPNSINLESGWNLVGYNSTTPLLVADALASIDGKYLSVWDYAGPIDDPWRVYDPANPGFSDLTTMEPGYGYWINTTEACTWTLP